MILEIAHKTRDPVKNAYADHKLTKTSNLSMERNSIICLYRELANLPN